MRPLVIQGDSYLWTNLDVQYLKFEYPWFLGVGGGKDGDCSHRNARKQTGRKPSGVRPGETGE